MVLLLVSGRQGIEGLAVSSYRVTEAKFGTTDDLHRR